MKWIHVKATFTGGDTDLAEDLITDIFLTLGINGVVCTVPLFEPAQGIGSEELPQPTETAISGYLPDMDASLDILSAIETRTRTLGNIGIAVTVTTEQVDPEDWAESWKEFFFVTRITDRIVIKPAWREFEPGGEDLIIHIDPGMAFGTGTHPTTAMCVALIQDHLRPGDTLLDVGTGSGILLIAAGLLGAAQLSGIDTDAVAISVARDNVAKNNLETPVCCLETTPLHLLADDHNRPYDVIVANIIAEVILELLPDMKKRLNADGTLILSGIIANQYPRVRAALHGHGLTPQEVRREGEWVAIAARSMASS